MRGGGNLYSYPTNPVDAIDPFGLFKIDDGTLKAPVKTLMVLAACKTSPVACTIGLNASISFDCDGCGNEWRPTNVTLWVRGQIYAYAGNPKTLKKTIVDKSVVDFASAVKHEHAWHIDIAIAAVSPIISSFENTTFESEVNCEDAGIWTNWEVQSRFTYVYQETQKIENKGGDPTKVPF